MLVSYQEQFYICRQQVPYQWTDISQEHDSQAFAVLTGEVIWELLDMQ